MPGTKRVRDESAQQPRSVRAREEGLLLLLLPPAAAPAAAAPAPLFMVVGEQLLNLAS
jgi:hypothetical protein